MGNSMVAFTCISGLKRLGAGKGTAIELMRGHALREAAHDFIHPAFSGQGNIGTHEFSVALVQKNKEQNTQTLLPS